MGTGTLKRRLAHLYYRATAVAAEPLPAKRPPGRPIVAGFLRSASGIGESARLCLDALTRLGCDPRALDLTERFQPQGGLSLDLPGSDDGATGPLILHVNPPELEAVTSHLGRRLMRGRSVFGYWAWELPRIPENWARAGRFVHEIWVPSTFCAEAVGAAPGRPVRVVPHPLSSRNGVAHRARFGLPEDALVVLAVADLRSSLERKNLWGMVDAFRLAFGDRNDRVLALKLGGLGADPALAEQVLGRLQATSNPHLLQEALSPAAMQDLFASVDIVLSLHRSEGFGLVVAQAMMAGKAVVATDWSATKDFTGPESAALVPASLVSVVDPQGIYPDVGQHWAEPDIEAASVQLRRLADEPETRLRLGRNAALRIREHCSDERYWNALGERFRLACLTGPENL